MYKICFYVPVTHVEQVKDAMFSAGAGNIGNYTNVAWQVLGEGQFMPLSGSEAFIGQVDCLEKIAEFKVEMVCAEQKLEAVIRAFRTAHPYEEPAFQVIKLENFV